VSPGPTVPAGPPKPLTAPYGVLMTPISGSETYTVSIIGVVSSGQSESASLAASAQATSPPPVSCGGTGSALVSAPVSTSDTRLYFMDAQGKIRFLAPDGGTGVATTVPVPSASRRAMFAVSADDRRIAVVVDDFSSGSAATRLYVEDLNGGANHLDLFSETGPFTLWPIGWHGTTNLVLAKVASCSQGGGPSCCGPLELHLVDPATGNRRYTIGGSNCVIAGPPTAAGAVCEDTSTSTATVLDWTSAVTRTMSISGPEPAFISPHGTYVALVGSDGVARLAGIPYGGADSGACGWISEPYMLARGDALHSTRVYNVGTGFSVPVFASGDCAGYLPGGL
jgi:hypothetical protein